MQSKVREVHKRLPAAGDRGARARKLGSGAVGSEGEESVSRRAASEKVRVKERDQLMVRGREAQRLVQARRRSCPRALRESTPRAAVNGAPGPAMTVRMPPPRGPARSPGPTPDLKLHGCENFLLLCLPFLSEPGKRRGRFLAGAGGRGR